MTEIETQSSPFEAKNSPEKIEISKEEKEHRTTRIPKESLIALGFEPRLDFTYTIVRRITDKNGQEKIILDDELDEDDIGITRSTMTTFCVFLPPEHINQDLRTLKNMLILE